MNSLKLTLLCLLAAMALPAQQQTPPQKQQRDLRYEDEKPPEPARTGAISIPRSYALIIGVAQYQNLPAEAQLKYSERDAEAIYSILISPEGGNFRAENVRKLVGPRATLANVRKEVEE